MDYLNNLFEKKAKQEEIKKYFKDIDTNEKIKKIYEIIINNVDFIYIEQFVLIAKPVINSYEFQRRVDFPHHGKESVVEHSIKVASMSYKIARYFNINETNAVLASLMHDMYSTPWQNQKNTGGLLNAHGFVHARIALNNCKKYYPDLMNEVIEDSILRHMFPLNIKRPKYDVGWLIVFCDKYVSMSIFKDVKNLPSYVGIKKLKNN